MKLYNTLTRSVEPVQSIDGKTYRVYSCGPTVYDHAHIGNLSAYIFADTLRRVLEITGEKQAISVKHVMNYTDVDDKTIRRSREQYPDDDPAAALHKLTDHYIALFRKDMQTIGNAVEPVTFVRATESIADMQVLIRRLYEKGFAYIAEDGIYFSIDAYRKSGKKYGQLLELSAESTSEARIQNDEYDKESIHDFALWKTKKTGEPSWDFEIDGHTMAGRPGWHIECSAMSENALGQPFDIHTGGVDLIFPHHENEIAQSTAGRGNPIMAKFFTHNEHILVDGRKMSKSANNFYTLNDIINRGYDPLSFRLLVLQSRYRNSTNLTWEGLEAAQNRLKEYLAMAQQRWQASPEGSVLAAEIEDTQARIEDCLINDLDTPGALAALSSLEKAIDRGGINTSSQTVFIAFLEWLDHALGLRLSEEQDITHMQKSLIARRSQARARADWKQSDDIRNELQEQAIGIQDTDRGTIWYRL